MIWVLGPAALLVLAGMVGAVATDMRGRLPLVALALGGLLVFGGSVSHLTSCGTGQSQSGCVATNWR